MSRTFHKAPHNLCGVPLPQLVYVGVRGGGRERSGVRSPRTGCLCSCARMGGGFGPSCLCRFRFPVSVCDGEKSGKHWKHKTPLKRTTYSNTFGALFSENAYTWKNGPEKRIWTSYIHSICMVFWARKCQKNTMQKAFSCSSAFRGNRRVTRKLWKWVPKVPQNVTRIKVFSLDFQTILSGPLSGFWVRNRPRAPKPWILFERQAADLGVFLGKSHPETINIP